jgi:osmotically-inducible protein OsmY
LAESTSIGYPGVHADFQRAGMAVISLTKQERVMNISSNKRILVVVTYLGAVVSGLAGFAAPAGAQTAAAPAVIPSGSVANSATTGPDSVTDRELRLRVQTALHSDRYFYDEHVRVSVDNGVVVLHGFVFSDWDLRDAMRIASRAAGRRVVDDLSIEVGGLR